MMRDIIRGGRCVKVKRERRVTSWSYFEGKTYCARSDDDVDRVYRVTQDDVDVVRNG